MKRLGSGSIALALLLSGFGGISVSAQAEKEQNMIVVFEEQLDEAEMKETIEGAGGTPTEEYGEVGIASAELTETAIDELRQDPAVHTIEEDAIFELQAQKEDWGIATSNIPAAWNAGFTGKGIKIAVIDSGISRHEDLKLAGGVSTVDYTQSYNDDQGHGTHVAGIIGGLNNGYGVKGVAYDAQLYAVKAFDADGQAFVSDMIEGINWSVANGMDIINLSAGSQTDSSAFKAAADKAYDSGLLIVAAAGNDGDSTGKRDTVDFPARYPSVIAVGAVDRYSRRTEFSSTGSSVEVAAPGDRILSTYTGNQYAYLSGTSMATPYAAGELALIKEAYPSLGNKELRQVLINHTRDAGPAGKDPYYGYGIIRASSFAAMPLLQPAPALTPFADVQSFYAPAVDYLVKREITRGKSASEFGVDENIIRADAAIWLAKELSLNTADAKPSGFSDVPERAAGAVNALKQAGIIGGKTAARFGSSDSLTRGEVALILQRAYKLEAGDQPSIFTDASPRYAGAVNALVANGVTNGLTASQFGVSRNITRGQLAVFIYRLAK